MELDVKKIDFGMFADNSIIAKKVDAQDKGVSSIIMYNNSDKESENITLLERCSNYHESLRDFRDRRMRNRKYVRGDQWYELMLDPETGVTMSEEDYISSRGKIPFKQNILSGIVKNLIGRYRLNPTQSIAIPRAREKAKEADIMSNAISAVHETNSTVQIDVQNLREFLISGMTVWKSSYIYMKIRDTEDIFIETINPNFFFFNSDFKDIRNTDINLIGQILDVPIDDVIGSFAKNEADAKLIREWYDPEIMDYLIDIDALKPTQIDNISFLNTVDNNKCRLYEIWQLKAGWRTYAHDNADGSYKIVPYTMEQIGFINKQRIEEALPLGVPIEKVPLIDARRVYDQFWYVKYLTPYGKCLYEGETVYKHKEHPFTFVVHPKLDNEVYGMIEDLLDQQRAVNHLVTLQAFTLGVSSKGSLLVAEESIGDMNVETIADEYSKVGGVITYKSRQGTPVPQQISTNSYSPAAQEQLVMQINLLEKISGISGAAHGETAKSNTPASLYAQEAANSTINSQDIMKTFTWAIKQRDYKVLQLIQQYYESGRHIRISGGYASDVDTETYDSEAIKDVQFDLVIQEAQDTPTYRMLLDDVLWKLLEAGMVDLKMFLSNSSLPFADKLLKDIEIREQGIASGEVEQGSVSDELMAEMQKVKGTAGKQISPEGAGIMKKLSGGLGNY